MREEQFTFGAPLRRQNKLLGISLRFFGVALYVVSVFFAITAVNPANKYDTEWFSHETPLRNLFVVVALLALSYLLANVARIVRRHGRRHATAVIRTMDAAKENPYVLFLRPFAADKTSAQIPEPSYTSLIYGFSSPETVTIEEILSRSFRRFGRLIAVGQPDERLPQPGAARLYLPMHGWQRGVSSLIDDAGLIVLVTGTSAGTLWELSEVMRRRKPHHLLLIVFSDEDEYDRFRARADPILAEHANTPAFPDYPPLFNEERESWLPIIRGFIWFGDDWTPHFERLDPTAVEARRKKQVMRLMVDTQVQPVFNSLATRHVAEAVEENRLDMGRRMPLARIERFVSGFVEAERGEGVPVRATLTPGFGVKNVGSTMSALETGDDPAFTVDIPAGALLGATRKARERGAGDSDTLRLAKKNNWGPWLLVVEPTGIELRVDKITVGREDLQGTAT